MIYLLVSFGLLLHILIWGVGLALLATPVRWRRFWPVWIAPCGIVLQSAVVWSGAHTPLAGTDVYGRWTLLLPLALLAWGVKRRGMGQCGRDLRRFAGLGVLMAVCLLLLTLPLARLSRDLTTASIGSCDAADYAAGARVFQEFASNDRNGFLGLTEVVQVASVDNFYDFWLKLNHFTPSALIALNDSVLGLAPHQTTGLLTVVLLVLVMPMVFWLARSTAGFGRESSAWLTFIFAISPVTGYAVYNVAPGQILAAQAIALVTWAGVAMWREPGGARRGWTYAGFLLVGFGIIWGAYNFIVTVCLVPAIGCVAGWALEKNEFRKLARWLGWMLLPLGGSAGFFYARAAGLVERFLLFRQYDFGWKIPLLRPEGWLGMVSGVGPRPLGELTGGASWILGGLTVLLLLAAWLLSLIKRWKQAWLVVAFLFPVMGGYAFLEWRGLKLNNNASYDAYKLFSVFYPVLLVAFCHWLLWLKDRSSFLRGLALAMIAVVSAMNLRGMYVLSQRVESTQLVVGKDLLDVQRVEGMDRIKSVNILVPDFWARLWANALMLHKPQYFPTHTYEGRLDTPLRGEWDFNGGMLQVHVPGPDCEIIDRRYSLVRTASPNFIRASLGEGWYGTERLRGRQTMLWNWTKGDAALEITNPQDHPLKVVLHFMARSLITREIQIWVGGIQLRTVQLDTELKPVRVPSISIPPGKVTVWLRSNQPPTRAGVRDERLLGFAAYSIVVDVRPKDESMELEF
jgi:hypothetical protein